MEIFDQSQDFEIIYRKLPHWLQPGAVAFITWRTWDSMPAKIIRQCQAELFRVKHGYAFKGDFFDTIGDYVLLTPGNFNESGGFRDQGEKQKRYSGDVPN